jgi:hypothetical protein
MKMFFYDFQNPGNMLAGKNRGSPAADIDTFENTVAEFSVIAIRLAL